MPSKKKSKTSNQNKARTELATIAYFSKLWSDLSSRLSETPPDFPPSRPDARLTKLLKSLEVDGRFRKRLVSSPTATLKKSGFQTAGKIRVVENTGRTAFLVLPKLVPAKQVRKDNNRIDLAVGQLTSLRAQGQPMAIFNDDSDPNWANPNDTKNKSPTQADGTDPTKNFKNTKNDIFG